MQKHFLLTATCIFFLCAVATAQIVKASHVDGLAARKKGGALSTSSSSGGGAGGLDCWDSVLTNRLHLLDESTAILCLNDTLELSASDDGFNYYQWYYFNDAIDSYSNGYDDYGNPITSTLVTKPGIYYYSDDECTVGILVTSIIPIDSMPVKTNMCTGSVELKAPADTFASYQWFNDDNMVPDETSSIYNAQLTGNYYVQLTDNNNCVVNSDKVNVTFYNTNSTSEISGDSCSNSRITLTNDENNLNPETIVWYRNNDSINSFNNNGIVVAGGNEAGNGLNQLDEPYGIFLDSINNVYVADYNNYRIMKWKPNSTSGEIAAQYSNSFGGQPTDVLVNTSDLIISTTSNILKLSPPFSVTEIFRWGSYGLATDRDKNIYASYNESVYKIDPVSYDNIEVAGGYSNTPLLTEQNGIYFDSLDNFYITNNPTDSFFNYYGRITEWHSGDMSGTNTAGGNGYGNAPNQIWFAADVTFDKLGNMYVSDAINNRVQLWKPGADHGITVASGFTPWGIAVDDSLNLYVADQTNNAVRKFPSLLYNTITADATGVYKAVVTYPGGCTVTSNDFVVKECGVLANTFLNFSAQLKNKNAELNWETASEKNISYFNVERSLNGTSFTNIGKVYASNNNNTIHNYTYADADITNFNTNKIYYRLTEVDKDGSTLKSNVVLINLNKTGWNFTISPNPVFSNLKVQLNNLYGITNVSIIDITGRKIKTQQLSATGNNELHFNVNSLANGLYFVRVFNSNHSEYIKFLKQ
jgi:hypothetical protein